MSTAKRTPSPSLATSATDHSNTRCPWSTTKLSTLTRSRSRVTHVAKHFAAKVILALTSWPTPKPCHVTRAASGLRINAPWPTINQNRAPVSARSQACTFSVIWEVMLAGLRRWRGEGLPGARQQQPILATTYSTTLDRMQHSTGVSVGFRTSHRMVNNSKRRRGPMRSFATRVANPSCWRAPT